MNGKCFVVSLVWAHVVDIGSNQPIFDRYIQNVLNDEM